MAEEKKIIEKKSFLILGILFIIAGLAISLVRLPYIQVLVISLCEKVKGQALNLDKTFQKLQSFIIMNTAILILIGIGFLLFRKIKFDTVEADSSPKLKVFSKKVFESRTVAIAACIIFTIIAGIHIYWSTQKVNYHQDECYGIGLANISEHNFWTGKKFPNYTPFSGEQIKTDVFFDDASLKDVVHDVAKLWFYNNDTAYTSLYLMLFRLSFIGTKTYNFSEVCFHGIALNFICLCFAIYFLLRILCLLNVKDKYKPFILFIAFTTRAAVMNTIYIREYAFQQAVLLLFTFIFLFYYKAASKNEKAFTKSNFIKTTLLLGIVLSTSYFTLFYITFFGLFLLGFLIYKKRSEHCIFLISSILISMLVAKMLYLNWGSTLLSGRGAEALHGEGNGNFLSNLAYFDQFTGSYYMTSPFLYVLAIVSVCGLVFLIKKGKKENFAFTVAFIAMAWAFFVTYITPSKGPSYILPCFASFSLFFISIIESSETFKLKRQLGLALIVIFSSIFIYNVLPLSKNRLSIRHLTDTPLEHSSPTFISEPEIPVVIKDVSSYPEILPYLADNQTYWFAKSMEDAIENIQELPNTFFYVEFKYHEIPYSITKINKNEILTEHK